MMNVPIDVDIPINVSTPIDMNVSVDVDVSIYIDVFTAVIPVAVTVPVISRRYNYTRAVTTAPVITITIVAASPVVAIPVVAVPVIATGRINFTRLKSQCAEGQRKDRKQCFHTVPSFVNNIPPVNLTLHLRRVLRHCRLRRIPERGSARCKIDSGIAARSLSQIPAQ